jgi:hypothetical protein
MIITVGCLADIGGAVLLAWGGDRSAGVQTIVNSWPQGSASPFSAIFCAHALEAPAIAVGTIVIVAALGVIHGTALLPPSSHWMLGLLQLCSLCSTIHADMCYFSALVAFASAGAFCFGWWLAHHYERHERLRFARERARFARNRRKRIKGERAQATSSRDVPKRSNGSLDAVLQRGGVLRLSASSALPNRVPSQQSHAGITVPAWHVVASSKSRWGVALFAGLQRR